MVTNVTLIQKSVCQNIFNYYGSSDALCRKLILTQLNKIYYFLNVHTPNIATKTLFNKKLLNN